MLTLRVNGKWRHGLAHRIAYAVFIAPLPETGVVMHTCDNRGCVRPDHLRLGTQSQNIVDMYEKGRRSTETYARGERHTNSKLSDSDVQIIKASYTGRHGEVSALARQFGVTPQAVSAIVKKGGWAHIPKGDVSLPTEQLKRRTPVGERSSRALLTDAQVRAMRDTYDSGKATQAELMRQYGISRPSVCLIVNRKSWRHIP
jgi:DNA-binding MarR family transcriptional regulator